MSSRQAIDRGRESENDLANRVRVRSLNQGRNSERVRPHPVQSRQQAAKDMVPTPENTASLHRPKGADVFHDHQQRLIPTGVGANLTGIACVQRAATTTRAYGRRRRGQRLRKRNEELVFPLQERQCDPPS